MGLSGVLIDKYRTGERAQELGVGELDGAGEEVRGIGWQV